MLGAKEIRRWGGQGGKTCRPWPSVPAWVLGTSRVRRTRSARTPRIRNRTKRPRRDDCCNIPANRRSAASSRQVGHRALPPLPTRTTDRLIRKTKNPQPKGNELRIAPCFLDPQGGAGRDHAARTPIHTGRSSGFWISLLPAPSRDDFLNSQWLCAGFVPNYSGGTATASHRLPSFPFMGPVC